MSYNSSYSLSYTNLFLLPCLSNLLNLTLVPCFRLSRSNFLPCPPLLIGPGLYSFPYRHILAPLSPAPLSPCRIPCSLFNVFYLLFLLSAFSYCVFLLSFTLFFPSFPSIFSCVLTHPDVFSYLLLFSYLLFFCFLILTYSLLCFLSFFCFPFITSIFSHLPFSTYFLHPFSFLLFLPFSSYTNSFLYFLLLFPFHESFNFFPFSFYH